ncbi:MAG TPA: hypothetical protein VFJ19_01970 [Nocardioidaceae bacterium]|nr:hypothetical protein [Nocardioidaceae bacterium]
MSNDSTLYTVGTALRRAHDNNVMVSILIEGSWISGSVEAVDGHGVVLDGRDGDHTVIRMESVSAVRIMSPAPERTPIPAGAYPTVRPQPAPA